MDGFVAAMGESVFRLSLPDGGVLQTTFGNYTREAKMKASWSKRFHRGWTGFKKDPAGERFGNLYTRIRRLPTWLRIVSGGLGLALGLSGLALGLIPGVPGIFFGLIGFALVAAQFKCTAQGADRLEVALRNFWRALASRFGKKKATLKTRSRRTVQPQRSRRPQRNRAALAGS